MTCAYYNERDPHAAQWLRNLIDRDLIAPGVVDERSIEDVRPDELAGFTQCHFFAGIGVWSYALRLAGWPDDRHVWTGSCPCQPFSAAGKGNGFADERHLWPAWHWLIRGCRPSTVFGEQVASKDGLGWFDLVRADFQAAGYAGWGADICAASVGAPHIRQRLYFVANAESVGLLGRQDDGDSGRRERASGQGCAAGELEHAPSDGRIERRAEPGQRGVERGCGAMRSGATNGVWRDADWIGCTDGRWRAVEPGTFPLVDGFAFRMGRSGAVVDDAGSNSRSSWAGKSRAQMLRGYGNAIAAPLAAEFIAAAMEVIP